MADDRATPNLASLRKRENRWIIRLFIVLSALLLVYALYASLRFLADYHERPTNDDATMRANQRIDELENRIATLQQRQATLPKPTDSATQAYQEGLKEHDELLSELRAERLVAEQRLKEAGDLLKETKTTEERTRGGAALFLGIFGAIAALAIGQGYWHFQGWKDQADDAVKEIEAVKPDVERIKAVIDSLDTSLPKFIADAEKHVMDLASPVGATLTKADEIDHLTYLANPLIRFDKNRTEAQTRSYLLSLLMAARGHIARKTRREAENRLNEFFAVLADNPGVIEKREEAQGHSYLALVCYERLMEASSGLPWIQQLNRVEASRLRQLGFSEVKKSHECDPTWEHAYFVEALLYSRQYVPEDVADPTVRAAMDLDGQEKAIGLYKRVIYQSSRQSVGMGAWQNLACCLKRRAERSGDLTDYDRFKSELRTFPSEREIRQLFVSSGKQETERLFLWHAMLADAELFKQVAFPPDDYRLFWKGLLDNKMNMRNWRDDLQKIREASPQMKDWVHPPVK